MFLKNAQDQTMASNTLRATVLKTGRVIMDMGLLLLHAHRVRNSGQRVLPATRRKLFPSPKSTRILKPSLHMHSVSVRQLVDARKLLANNKLRPEQFVQRAVKIMQSITKRRRLKSTASQGNAMSVILYKVVFIALQATSAALLESPEDYEEQQWKWTRHDHVLKQLLGLGDDFRNVEGVLRKMMQGGIKGGYGREELSSWWNPLQSMGEFKIDPSLAGILHPNYWDEAKFIDWVKSIPKTPQGKRPTWVVDPEAGLEVGGFWLHKKGTQGGTGYAKLIDSATLNELTRPASHASTAHAMHMYNFKGDASTAEKKYVTNLGHKFDEMHEEFRDRLEARSDLSDEQVEYLFNLHKLMGANGFLQIMQPYLAEYMIKIKRYNDSVFRTIEWWTAAFSKGMRDAWAWFKKTVGSNAMQVVLWPANALAKHTGLPQWAAVIIVMLVYAIMMYAVYRLIKWLLSKRNRK